MLENIHELQSASEMILR